MPLVHVLGYAGCARFGEVLALLRHLDVPHSAETIERPAGVACESASPHGPDGCGYVSPAVEIVAGRSRPVLLVQPTDADLTDALAHHGILPVRGLLSSLPARTAPLARAARRNPSLSTDTLPRA